MTSGATSLTSEQTEVQRRRPTCLGTQSQLVAKTAPGFSCSNAQFGSLCLVLALLYTKIYFIFKFIGDIQNKIKGGLL